MLSPQFLNCQTLTLLPILSWLPLFSPESPAFELAANSCHSYKVQLLSNFPCPFLSLLTVHPHPTLCFYSDSLTFWYVCLTSSFQIFFLPICLLALSTNPSLP